MKLYRLGRRGLPILFVVAFLLIAAVALLMPGQGLLLRLSDDPVIDISRPGDGPTIGAVHFGGPDKPAGALAQLLIDRVNATPPGQRIDWVTYYFRDRDLARALIAASDRGVNVQLVVDGDPRLHDANDAALGLLRRHGLNGGLVLRRIAVKPLDLVDGQLHTKIYAFSWPRAVALIGSFNPSGDEDTSAQTLAAIGDQDRGHNVLVELTSHALVDRVLAQVDALARGQGTVSRLAPGQNQVYRDRDTSLFFYPRLRAEVVEDQVGRLGQGDRLTAAISHLKGLMPERLSAAALRGAHIDLIVHDSERRVPEKDIVEMRAAGVHVLRYQRPDQLPMHAKFIVIQGRLGTISAVGSLNYNRNSRLLNDELLVESTNKRLADTLLKRFAVIAAEAGLRG